MCHCYTLQEQSFAFAEDLVLLVSSEQGRQHTPGQFSAACDETEMKLSTKKTEVRLSRN